MSSRWLLTIAACFAIAGPASAQTNQRRAALTGGGDANHGKCTIEVLVDGAADVEIRGDNGTLRNENGQPPQWRRFECTGPLPPNPGDFRFVGVDGRGRQELVRDPRQGGMAVVRIEDRQGGAEGYTFDLIWNNGGGSPGNVYPGPQVRDRREGDGIDNNPRVGRDRPIYQDRPMNRRFSTEEAVQVCQDAVRQQAVERFRTPNIAFRRTALEDAPGRRDWVSGTFGVRRGYGGEEPYRFSCSVNFDTGVVRSAQIEAVNGPRDTRGYAESNVPSNTSAMQSCERAAEENIRRDGFQRIQFGSINVDNRPGRNDWIVGTARADGRYGSQAFDFSCSVNLQNGVVRSVDVQRR